MPVSPADLLSLLPSGFMISGWCRNEWRPIPAEQPAKADLATGGRQQVLAPDHHVDALLHVIHHDRELVGPLAKPVAHEQVTALGRRFLRLRPKAEVVESLGAGRHHDAARLRDGPVDATRAAAAG